MRFSLGYLYVALYHEFLRTCARFVGSDGTRAECFESGCLVFQARWRTLVMHHDKRYPCCACQGPGVILGEGEMGWAGGKRNRVEPSSQMSSLRDGSSRPLASRVRARNLGKSISRLTCFVIPRPSGHRRVGQRSSSSVLQESFGRYRRAVITRRARRHPLGSSLASVVIA